jgi:hypothetical protein
MSIEEDRLISEIEGFLDLGDGWDGENAAKPNVNAIKQAVRFVRAAGELASQLEPGLHVDGSVLLEIGNGIEACICFTPADKIVYSWKGAIPGIIKNITEKLKAI